MFHDFSMKYVQQTLFQSIAQYMCWPFGVWNEDRPFGVKSSMGVEDNDSPERWKLGGGFFGTVRRRGVETWVL